MEPVSPPDIYIGKSEGKGRGAFSARAFVIGEIVERAPVILVLPQEIMDCEALRHRAFQWRTRKSKNMILQAVVFGYGSLYNHANPANMRWYGEEDGDWIVYEAIRDIARDEELTINYDDPDGASDDERWFAKHKVGQRG